MHRNASLGLAIAVMLLAGYGIFAASSWPAKAALFPLAIGIPLFALAAAEALWTLFGAPPARQALSDLEPTAEPAAQRRIAIAAGWIFAFFAAVVLLGFPIAIPLFLFLYLKLQGGEGWALSIGVTVVVSAVFYGLFEALLHLPFQAGWLFSWLGFG